MNGVVYGVLAELTPDEVNLLYSQERLNDYKPRSVFVKKKDGKEVAASCYTAPLRKNALPKPEYVNLLIEVAKSHGFPPWYIERLRKVGLSNE